MSAVLPQHMHSGQVACRRCISVVTLFLAILLRESQWHPLLPPFIACSPFLIRELQFPRGTTAIPPIIVAGAMLLRVKQRPHGSVGSKQVEAKSPAMNESIEPLSHFLSFNQSQLSLAISILKSKPADIGIREYCFQLQKHVKQGRLLTSGEHRYIDTAEFWKDQYSKIHSENMALKMDLAQLKALGSETQSNSGVATSELCFLGRTVCCQPDTAFDDAESTNNLPILRQALEVYRLLQDDSVSTELLTSAIISLLSQMSSTINLACITTNREQIRGRGSFNNGNFKAVSAIFNICLKGLVHLCRDIPGRRSRGQVVYSLVRFVTNALDQLNGICLQRIEYQPSNTSHLEVCDSQKAHYEHTTKTLAIISGLAKLLVDIFTCPEFSNAHPSCTEVLEGIFASLLGNTGKLVSQLVFEEQFSTVCDSAPKFSLRTSGTASIHSPAIDLKCQCLAYILKRVLGDRTEKDKHSLAAIIISTESLHSTSKKTILAQVNQRLQETLLEGIFGRDGEQFMNVLQTPEYEEGWDITVPRNLNDERDAFLESVWSIVGWDMLRDN